MTPNPQWLNTFGILIAHQRLDGPSELWPTGLECYEFRINVNEIPARIVIRSDGSVHIRPQHSLDTWPDGVEW